MLLFFMVLVFLFTQNVNFQLRKKYSGLEAEVKVETEVVLVAKAHAKMLATDLLRKKSKVVKPFEIVETMTMKTTFEMVAAVGMMTMITILDPALAQAPSSTNFANFLSNTSNLSFIFFFRD